MFPNFIAATSCMSTPFRAIALDYAPRIDAAESAETSFWKSFKVRGSCCIRAGNQLDANNPRRRTAARSQSLEKFTRAFLWIRLLHGQTVLAVSRGGKGVWRHHRHCLQPGRAARLRGDRLHQGAGIDYARLFPDVMCR